MMTHAQDGAAQAHHSGSRDRAAGPGSFIVDERGTILGFDRGMEELTGWPAAEVVGRDKDLTFRRPYREPGDREAAVSPLYEGRIPIPPSSARLALRLGCRDGRSVEVEAEVSRETGAEKRITVRVLRIVARSAGPAVSWENGGRDPLTGLPDRDTFARGLSRCFREALESARPLALILADVDHFRWINDRMGRAAGDDVLRKLAGIFRATVGIEDLVFRLGDDDLAILLPGSGRGEARQLAARLRSTVARFRFFGLKLPDAPPPITLSLGAASLPADADNDADLVARSREALNEARLLGRNRVWCYMRRPRVPVRTPVFFDGAEPLLLGHTRDLSPSGVFVETSSPVEIGMRCALSFPLPQTDGKVHVIGRVVRTVPPRSAPEESEGPNPGMGIEFERFGAEDRKAIDTYLHANESLTARPERGMLSV